MPRFSLGDAGAARWLLSHRWTDTSPILPDAAHDSRNQGRTVSLSALSLLSCVRLRQLREVHHNHLAASAESSLTDAGRSIKRFTCLLHISDVTPVHAQGTLSILFVRSLLVLLLCKHRCLSCLTRPVWSTIGPCGGVFRRTNARCVVGQ